jgi:hypothetical protein
MKHKNPYVISCIIWSVLTIIFQTASVVLFVESQIVVGAILLVVSCGFAFSTGVLLQKAREIAAIIRQEKWMREFAKELCEQAKEERERVEREPFDEFLNTGDLPFPPNEK